MSRHFGSQHLISQLVSDVVARACFGFGKGGLELDVLRVLQMVLSAACIDAVGDLRGGRRNHIKMSDSVWWAQA